MTPHAQDEPTAGRSFLARYGATILGGGIAAIPAALFRYQGELGLSAQEIWFIGYILACKWTTDLPHPSLRQMAERSGYTEQQIHRIKNALLDKGVLVLIPRRNALGGLVANAYDFGSLFGRLETLLRRDGVGGDDDFDDPPSGLSGSGGNQRRQKSGGSTASQANSGATAVIPPPDTGVRTPTNSAVSTPTNNSAGSPLTRELGSPLTPQLVLTESADPESDPTEPASRRRPRAVRHIPVVAPPTYDPRVVRIKPRRGQGTLGQTDSTDRPRKPVSEVMTLLCRELGMTARQARRCVEWLEGESDLKGYVQRLIDAAYTAPGVHNPAGLVVSWMRDHAEPPAPPCSTRGRLDRRKYLFGEYAYLFNPEYNQRGGENR